ncbi:MAG: class I SAM-dependent methyltransferase [Actinobacteria bacterium]|nr:class I SAM-dependent methyltransferase [Actinomycetota bacterium]MCA1720363.1 class I SAM-dependent methyltransferase [Actinomycetota bacterium]
MSRVESDYYAYMGYDRDNTLSGLRHYLPWLAQGPVLELAPGRGEMLSLLRDAGVQAYGVDLDEGMVEQAAAEGLDVRLGDALEGLRAAGDGTLGGVFSAHFVEHLQPDVVAEVVRESARALAPGGHFVAATPNAACWSVMGHDFWRDPTHVRFYEPRLLAFFCAQAGLEVVETDGNPLNMPGPPPETRAHPVTVDPDMTPDLAVALQRITDPKSKGKVEPDSPWYAVGHFVSSLMGRLERTQEELRELRGAYDNLLQRMYPSNEIYVVARRG